MLKILLAALLLIPSMSMVGASDIESILKMPHRAKNMARDQYRHPAETLAFFQLAADQKVLEIWPGPGGWYTEILAPYLRDKGKLVLGHYDPNHTNNYYVRNYAKLITKLDASPDLYDQAEMVIFQPPKLELGEPASYDRVVTFRNLHNWTRADQKELTAIFNAFYDVLKPGGKLGMIDHRLPEDRPTKTKGGYVKQSYAIELAEAAGFKLEATSEINANPRDTADHEKGVWSLPPSYRMGEKNRDKFEAIGESDRMTLLFVKPE